MMKPRDERGRIVSRFCRDPNCGGVLVYEPIAGSQYRPGVHAWHCDGLTHERGDAPLVACDHSVIGAVIAPAAGGRKL